MPSNVFELPFSGGVSQAINPWNWWANVTGNSTGLVNITNYKSAAPATEQKIVREVAGYGSQLGRITEALEAVIAALPKEKLSPAQKSAFRSFEELAEKIREAKQEAALEALSPSGIDGFLSSLERLKESDKAAYARAVEKVKAAVK